MLATSFKVPSNKETRQQLKHREFDFGAFPPSRTHSGKTQAYISTHGVCVSPDLMVDSGQRLTGTLKSKEKPRQYTSMLNLPSVCEETRRGTCEQQ